MDGYHQGRMRLIRNRADVAGATLLAVLGIASAALALLGFEVGLVVLLLLVGTAIGMALVHFATKPRRARKPVALLLLLGIFALPVAALTLQAEWLVLALRISEVPFGPFFFGLIIGAVQVAFGRLIGRGAWAGD